MTLCYAADETVGFGAGERLRRNSVRAVEGSHFLVALARG
jgi:hypothetical protein